MSESENPIFLNKSEISDVSEITDNGSTTDAVKIRLLDRNDQLKYRLVGVTTGDRIITWTPPASATISRIWIQNCNFEDVDITFNGGSDFSPAISLTGNTDKHLYFEFADQAVNTVEITVGNIFGGGSGLATAGEIYIGTERFQVGANLGSERLEALPDVAQTIFTLSDNTKQKVFIRRTIDYQFDLLAISDSDRQNFVALYELNRSETFGFIPRPIPNATGWDGLAGHYNWINAADFVNYTDGFFINGFDINIRLGQAGGFD